MGTTSINYASKLQGFGIFDPKNREVGAKVFTWEVDLVEGDRVWCKTYLKPGYHFLLQVTATRAGVGFGPSQYTQAFASAEEREVVIEKYLAGAYKRAEKNFQFNPDQA